METLITSHNTRCTISVIMRRRAVCDITRYGCVHDAKKWTHAKADILKKKGDKKTDKEPAKKENGIDEINRRLCYSIDEAHRRFGFDFARV